MQHRATRSSAASTWPQELLAHLAIRQGEAEQGGGSAPVRRKLAQAHKLTAWCHALTQEGSEVLAQVMRAFQGMIADPGRAQQYLSDPLVRPILLQVFCLHWLYWMHRDEQCASLDLWGMFGSAGVLLTRPAGCSETRHDRGHHQLSQRSSTHSHCANTPSWVLRDTARPCFGTPPAVATQLHSLTLC
jgi:hypothetical protein